MCSTGYYYYDYYYFPLSRCVVILAGLHPVLRPVQLPRALPLLLLRAELPALLSHVHDLSAAG